MDSKSFKAGNIKLVIIIFLAIVTLGGLGFAYWSNFLNKSSDSQSSNGAVKNPIKTIFIKEWSLVLSYRDLPGLGYSIKDNGANQELMFTSDTVKGCDITTVLGGITRSRDASNNNPKGGKDKIINGYSYSYREPTYVGCDDIKDQSVQDFVNNIHSIYLTIAPSAINQ